jgi:putative ABC transport system ATP-binding protein
MIELKKVSKSYHEAGKAKQVLCEVDTEIQQGEFIAIRGRSGSGKTTLLNLIAGIDEPSSGEIRVDGQSLQVLSKRERAIFRRDQVGIIFQFFNLLPTLTVLENVTLPAELARIDMETAGRRGRELLHQVGLAERAEEFPDRLSGGEQQRVAIARALMREPKIILADEPTGNLDLATGDEVMGLLVELVRQSLSTLVLVTHSYHIAALADRVLTIRECALFPEDLQAAPLPSRQVGEIFRGPNE